MCQNTVCKQYFVEIKHKAESEDKKMSETTIWALAILIFLAVQCCVLSINLLYLKDKIDDLEFGIVNKILYKLLESEEV